MSIDTLVSSYKTKLLRQKTRVIMKSTEERFDRARKKINKQGEDYRKYLMIRYGINVKE